MNAAMLVGGAVGAAGAIALRQARNRGALPGEIAVWLPGDELVPEPSDATTMAVDIDAPAEEVWRWLVQVGQGRGGLYSYDWLANLINLDIHSADRIRDEWQHLAVGDPVVMVPKGWGPLPAGYAMTVARIEAGRAIVLRRAPPEHRWNAVWSFVIEPLDALSCRLLSRSRAERPASAALRLATSAMAPVTTIMTRRMLLGIKERAERAVWPFGPDAEPRTRPVEERATTLDAPGGAS